MNKSTLQNIEELSECINYINSCTNDNMTPSQYSRMARACVNSFYKNPEKKYNNTINYNKYCILLSQFVDEKTTKYTLKQSINKVFKKFI